MKKLNLIIPLLFLILFLSFDAINPAAVAQTDVTPTPLPLFALPDARLNRSFTSGSMALLSDGRTLVATNAVNDTVTIAIPSQNTVINEIRVGRDPRGVAITLDDARALVTNRADGTLSVIDIRETSVIATYELGGIFPYAVVIGGNQTAYISLMGSDEIVEIDVNTGDIIARIAVPANPAGLALWGNFLYVTHFWTGDLTLIYLPQRRIAQTTRTGSDMGVTQAVELDITRGLAYVPGTRTFHENPSLTYDSAVFPVVNVVDLSDNAAQRTERIAVDTADRPVNLPFATALDRFSQRLYVVNAGSDDLSVIDLTTGVARAHVDVGSNPRGVLLNRDNTLLYVHNTLDATITTISTEDLAVLSTLPISNLTVSVDVLLGAQLFFGADDARMTRDSWLSCANCHFDGMTDGRVWRGFPDGARNTPVLYALVETPPYNWSATWTDLAQVELKIRALHGGTGLIEDSILPPPADTVGDLAVQTDLALLTAYLTTLTPPSPSIRESSMLIQRGAEVFAEQDCASCHVGAVGTNLQAYAVGTGAADEMFDTPSLRWLRWSAPYYHDGAAATLYEVFAREGTHQLIYTVSREDIDALIAYLFGLPE